MYGPLQGVSSFSLAVGIRANTRLPSGISLSIAFPSAYFLAASLAFWSASWAASLQAISLVLKSSANSRARLGKCLLPVSFSYRRESGPLVPGPSNNTKGESPVAEHGESLAVKRAVYKYLSKSCFSGIDFLRFCFNER